MSERPARISVQLVPLKASSLHLQNQLLPVSLLRALIFQAKPPETLSDFLQLGFVQSETEILQWVIDQMDTVQAQYAFICDYLAFSA